MRSHRFISITNSWSILIKFEQLSMAIWFIISYHPSGRIAQVFDPRSDKLESPCRPCEQASLVDCVLSRLVDVCKDLWIHFLDINIKWEQSNRSCIFYLWDSLILCSSWLDCTKCTFQVNTVNYIGFAYPGYVLFAIIHFLVGFTLRAQMVNKTLSLWKATADDQLQHSWPWYATGHWCWLSLVSTCYVMGTDKEN